MLRTGNYKEVYITRDSDTDTIQVWNPNVGIVKFQGCVYFASSRQLGATGQLGWTSAGHLDDACFCGMCNEKDDLREQFGFFPRMGTAWIVNITTLERKRIDKDMALIDPDTGKVIV